MTTSFAGAECQDLSLQVTADGSHTLYNARLNETYHSHKGALAEAKYVFIHAGMDAMLEKTQTLNIVEVGFGTGLNTLMTGMRTQEFARVQPIKVHYTSIEPYPLPQALVKSLNYQELLSHSAAELFNELHAAPWDQDVSLSSSFTLHKVHGRLEDFSGQDEATNLVYFDAFAPSKQAEVWALANLKKCFALLQHQGLLVSYCANGQFKRDLKSIGFTVQPYPGALGKREMTRAWKF